MGKDLGNRLLVNRLAKHGIEPIETAVRYTLMRTCHGSAMGGSGLDCNRFCSTYAKDCRLCTAANARVCPSDVAPVNNTLTPVQPPLPEVEQPPQRPPETQAARSSSSSDGLAFFTAAAYSTEPSTRHERGARVFDGRAYAPLPPGSLAPGVALLICSLRKVSQLATSGAAPVYVLGVHASKEEQALYSELGATFVDVTQRAPDMRSVWRPTFGVGRQGLPQVRTDGWLTLFKWHAFTVAAELGVRRGVFFDADVAIRSADVDALLAVALGPGCHASWEGQQVSRSFPYERLGWQSSTFAFAPSHQLFWSLLNASKRRDSPAYTNTDQDVFDGVCPPMPNASLDAKLGRARWAALKLHHHFRDRDVAPAFPLDAFDRLAPNRCARFWRERNGSVAITNQK